MKPLIVAIAFTLVAAALPSAAWAQTTTTTGLTITQLLNQGYVIRAASSNGVQQFLYFQGVDQAGRKKAYACQLQFGSNGGFQGCLALP
jgi:hypothetical protein